MRKYKNKFKVKFNCHDQYSIIQFLTIHGGMLRADPKLKVDEYWCETNADKETLKQSILIKLID